MKPSLTVATTRNAKGGVLSLHQHDGEYLLKFNGCLLASSAAAASESLLAELACSGIRGNPVSKVLVCGLGLGFPLKRVLELVGVNARVHVAEPVQEIVDWNRDLLEGLNGRLLRDRRVEVFVEDVFNLVERARDAKYDAVLLAVDSGPLALGSGGRPRLHEPGRLAMIRRALKPTGRVAFWSADEDPEFFERLGKSGFRVEAVGARSHAAAKRITHRIYVAEPIPLEPAPAARLPRRR